MAVSATSQSVNIQELARRFRVSRQTIYNWRDDGCPIEDGYDAIRQWIVARKEAAKESGDLAERKLLAECLKIETDTRRAEVKLRIALKEVVNADDVGRRIEQMVSLAKAEFESLPREVESEIPPEHRTSLVELMEHKIRIILLRLEQTRVLEDDEPEEEAGDE